MICSLDIRLTSCSSQIGTILFPILLEVVHLPTHITLYLKNRLHPGIALGFTIIMTGNWVTLTVWQVLGDLCAEAKFPETWVRLFWTRIALDAILAVLYLMYLITAIWLLCTRGKKGEKLGRAPERQGGTSDLTLVERGHGSVADGVDGKKH